LAKVKTEIKTMPTSPVCYYNVPIEGVVRRYRQSHKADGVKASASSQWQTKRNLSLVSSSQCD